MNAADQLRLVDVASDSPANGLRQPCPLPVRNPLARLLLLCQLIATIDQTDPDQLAGLLGCGFTPDLIQQLRTMPLADAVRFTANPCGVSVTVDAQTMRRQLAHVERTRSDQQLIEYFVRHGATPRLMCTLFRVGINDVRRLRRLVAPSTSRGGRPRALTEPLQTEVKQAWDQIRSNEPSDRQRLWLLHQQFSDRSIASLEAVLRRAGAAHRAGRPAPPAPPSDDGSRFSRH